MPIIVPNAASTYTTCQVIPLSANRWAWISFTPSVGASGSVMIYAGSATDGSPLLPIVCAAGQPFGPAGPYNSPCGFYAACVTGGSVTFWLRTAS